MVHLILLGLVTHVCQVEVMVVQVCSLSFLTVRNLDTYGQNKYSSANNVLGTNGTGLNNSMTNESALGSNTKKTSINKEMNV